MLKDILLKFQGKFRTLSFALFHGGSLGLCGAGAYIASPSRIDGASSIKIDDKTVFQPGVWLYCCSEDPEKEAELLFGKGCVFGFNNHITAIRKVSVGDYVLTANNVYISDNIHEYENVDVPIMDQPVKFKREVSIGSGSWIGENVCIIGASIGKNCIVGANSVVTRDIPDYSVAVGSPAKVIRQYCIEQKKWKICLLDGEDKVESIKHE